MMRTFTRTLVLSILLLLVSAAYGNDRLALAAHMLPEQGIATMDDALTTNHAVDTPRIRAPGLLLPDAIYHPGAMYLLLLFGIWGLLFEAFVPGLILPGVLGAVSLLAGLYVWQALPGDFSALPWILLGLICLSGELFLPGFGILGVMGVACFIMGLSMLLIANFLGFEVNAGFIAGVVLSAAVVLVITLWLLLRAHRAHIVSGDQQMLDATGTLLEDIAAGGTGWALIYGERWAVNSAHELTRGTRIKVTRRDGLTLWVDAIHSSS